LPCARTITHGKEGGLPCAMVITHGKLACQGAYAKPVKGVCRVTHDKHSFQEKPKIFYKSLPCALLSSRQSPSVKPVSHHPSPFFRRMSSLTHGKASPCADNLAVSKGKVRRGIVCRVLFAVSNTR